MAVRASKSDLNSSVSSNNTSISLSLNKSIVCSPPNKIHSAVTTTTIAQLNLSATLSTTIPASVKPGIVSLVAASQAQNVSSTIAVSSSIIPPTKPIAFAAVAKHNTSQPPAQTENGQYSSAFASTAGSAPVGSNASILGHNTNQQLLQQQQPSSVINVLQSINQSISTQQQQQQQHTIVSSNAPAAALAITTITNSSTNSSSAISASAAIAAIGNSQHNTSAGSASEHSTIFTSITNNLSTTSSSAVVANNSSIVNCLSPTSSLNSSRTSPGLTSPNRPLPSTQQPHAVLNGPTTTPGVNQQQLANSVNATNAANNDSMSSLKTIVQAVINRNAGLDESSLLSSSGNILPATSITGAPTPSDTRQQLFASLGGASIGLNDPNGQTNGPNSNSVITNHSAVVAAVSLSTNSLLKSNLLSASTNEAHIPPLLGVAPLGPSPLQKEHQLQFQMMEAAYYHLPAPSDSERLRTYLHRQPIQTPPHYPQVS